ncbi:MAG: hypothetical protein WBL84_21255 [Xanthobacteraceae bacterium]
MDNSQSAEALAHLLGAPGDWARLRAENARITARFLGTPDDLARLRAKAARIKDMANAPAVVANSLALAKLTEHIAAAYDRYQVAIADPSNERAEPWLALGKPTPTQCAVLVPYLPNPLARRGRRKGRSKYDKLVDQLAGCLVQNPSETPTTVARQLIEATGIRAGVKRKADRLVALLKNRSK